MDLPAGAPPMAAGLVGYMGYDMVKLMERLPDTKPDPIAIPDACFIRPRTQLIFDAVDGVVYIIAPVWDVSGDADKAYDMATKRIEKIARMLQGPLDQRNYYKDVPATKRDFTSNRTVADYETMIASAKEYIAAGDVFQFVPSQRFETPFSGAPVDLYRALRHVNPSPYMFLLELGDFALVGSSPEVHVRSINGRIDIRPIAGTRWRGKTLEEDDALAADLLNDPKERAEHLMLIDLARNDVGRIAKHGSVKVDDFMIIERYSHVMHIVSNVTGTLDPSHSAYDVLRATFPAGTVSGAPKIRAMQIINELEPTKRCAYAGAVGYFGFDGSHDSCITLRTCLVKNGKAYVQAGAGVVADSDPTYEYQETCNKAQGMLKAIALANTLSSES
jgi:anthranilate synthase component 1